MTKRSVDELVDGNQAYLKRQKISNFSEPTPPCAVEEIRSGRQLRQVLAFGQDASNSRQGTDLWQI
jgi:nucleolar pre-ribosomal-associated protein 1